MWGLGSCHLYHVSSFCKEEQSFSSALGVCWAISQTRSPSQQQGKGGWDALWSLGQKPSKQHSWELAALSQNRKKTKDFPFACRGFSKLILAPYSKAISFGCSQPHHFYIFECLYCHLGSFCCLADVGCASALAMEQKPESWLYPGGEFVQTCTTILDNALQAVVWLLGCPV